jgi:hypothetical protein
MPASVPAVQSGAPSLGRAGAVGIPIRIECIQLAISARADVDDTVEHRGGGVKVVWAHRAREGVGCSARSSRARKNLESCSSAYLAIRVERAMTSGPVGLTFPLTTLGSPV